MAKKAAKAKVARSRKRAARPVEAAAVDGDRVTALVREKLDAAAADRAALQSRFDERGRTIEHLTEQLADARREVEGMRLKLAQMKARG